MSLRQPQYILITGAGGKAGTALRLALREYRLRLLDRVPVPTDLGVVADDVLTGDIRDASVAAAAMRGIDTVVHLAGDPRVSAPWPEVAPANIDGAQTMLRAATEAGVKRVVYASSGHANGLDDRDRAWPVDPRRIPRPCCLYGVTKVAGETLARFYAETTGLSVICLRIGWLTQEPFGERGLRTWLSPGDLIRAVRAAMTTDVSFGVYFATSANTRSPWHIELSREIGFFPVDDAEAYAERIDTEADSSPPCYREPPFPSAST